MYTIKQFPDDYAESTGLSKHGKSRMPGCIDTFMAGVTTDGRYITGLDEKAPNVPKDYEAKIKELRESLQNTLGVDLSPFSKFWETFEVTISSDFDKVLSESSPRDMIAYRMLIANRHVAPTIEHLDNPLFYDTLYYFENEELKDKEKVTTRQLKDEAIVELHKMKDNKDKMVLYGQYLEGIKYDDKLVARTLYDMLRSYIETSAETAKYFLDAVQKTPDTLQQKILLDKAFKRKLIQKVKTGPRSSAYQYGNITLGNTVEEVYNKLSLPEYAPELLSIKNELEKL